MNNSSIPKSPFEEIISLETKKSKLLSDTLFKFEKKAITDLWLEFIEFSIPVLDRINFHAQTLYNRFYDEYDKELSSGTEEELKALTEKIKEILQFIFENTIIVDQHLLYLENNNVQNNILNYFVRNEMYKQFIGELFFKTKLPKDTLVEISDIMVNQYKVNQFERIISSLENSPEARTANFDLITSAYRTKSEYFLFDIGSKFNTISKKWWWDDHTILASIYEQAKFHLNSLNKVLIENKSNMIAEQALPKNLAIAMAKERFHQSKLLYDNGIKAATDGTHKQSSRYFSKVMENCEIGLAYLKNKENDKIDSMYEEFLSLSMKTRLVNLISKLTSKYNLISSHIVTNDHTAIMELINEIKIEEKEYFPEIEIKYLSALPDMYYAIASTIELLVSLGKEFEELSEILNQRMVQFLSRLDVAINQIVKELNNLNRIENYDETYTNVIQIKKDITILLETASFIPKNIIERISTIKKLQALQFLILSIHEDLLSFKHIDKNYIKVLIHKAKANYYAGESINHLYQQKTKGLPVERIHAQYSGSFITGYQKEIEIYELNIQFLCINDILPNFLSNLTNSNLDIELEEVKASLWNDKLFISMLQQINEDCTKLLDHMKTGNADSLSGVNWDTIRNKKSLVCAVLPFYESIKFAIMGSIACKIKKFDDAVQFFILAQDNAFSSNDPLKMSTSSSLGEYSTHLFSFGQFCQDSSNKARERKIVNLPVQEIVKLFRDMIFNL